MKTSMHSTPGRAPADLDNAAAEETVLQRRLTNIRHKILVLSGKGGVGKSTVAANLAVGLSRRENSVGLLDVDVHGPSIPKLLGIEGRPIAVVNEELQPIRFSQNLTAISLGLMLPSNRDPIVWRGPRKHGAIRQLLKDVAWGELDYLVVDSPPGTGDEPLSVAQMIGGTANALIVTTPQDVAVADVRRCITFCRSLSLPIVGIVENMSGLVCPACGERIDLFRRGGGVTLANEMQVPFLGSIPLDVEVVASGDCGVPLLSDDCQSPAAVAFTDLLQKLIAQMARPDEASGGRVAPQRVSARTFEQSTRTNR
jgi:Mrp family chromosome partitioning ATPase